MERDDSKNYQYQQPYLDLTYGGSEEPDEYNSDTNEPSFGGSLMDHHHHSMYTDSQQPYGLSANTGGSDEYEEDEDDDDPHNRPIATVEHTGRWTREEHEAFLLGLKKYGKEWKKVAAQVRTRTVVQTRTHAQKYFQKLHKSLMDQQKTKRSHGSRTRNDGTEEDDDENDNEDMKMIALMSSSQPSGNMDLDDYMPNVAAFTSSLSASGGRGNRGGRGGGSSKRNLAKGGSAHSSHPQPLLPPPPVLPSVPLGRRGSTATMNAAQVISTLSSAKTNDNKTVTAVSSSHSVIPGITTPSRFHGFSMSDEGNSIPWQQSNAMKMKITAPDPSKQSRYPFPEPSPAATGKRKLDEIAAAHMLVGGISGGGGVGKAARSSVSSNLMFDGPPTPPMSANDASGGGERHLHLKDAPPLPPLFSGGHATTSSKPSLHIVNPESLGVTVATTHRKGSPVTPWDGALEALVVQQSTNAAASAADDPDGVVDAAACTESATHALPAQHPNRSPVDGYNRNPLHQAVCAQDDSTVQTLLNVIGPQDLNQMDSAGYAPLHSACAARLSDTPGEHESHSNSIVRLLLGAGCNPMVTDPLGNTPLHWAVRAGDYDTTEQLLQQSDGSADQSDPPSYVDLPNHLGETSLHWALRLGMRGANIVQLLLSWKACPHSLNKEFKRPIDVAAEGFLDDETSLAYALAKRQKKGISNGGDTVNSSNGNGDGRKKTQEKEWKELLRRTRSDRCATRAFFLQHSTSSRTLVLHHPECLDHHPKSISDWETPARVETILQRIQQPSSSDESGCTILSHEIILSQEFDRGNLELLSRVHSTEYLSFVNQLSKELERKVLAKGISSTGVESDDIMDTATSSGVFSSNVVPFTPMVQRSMIKIDESSVKLSDNSDTSFSVGSLRAARRAAGAVQHAVDCVLSGKNRNAFCVVRPPGHHAGINGLLEGGESCGFCIFNNVAAGAMHAVAAYKDLCRRVAIVDIDVHHGNGTEEIVRRCNDPSTLFFFSIHLYDNDKDDANLQRKKNQFTYKFYPGTGTSDDLHMNIINVPIMPLWKDPNSLCTSSAPKTHNTRKKTRGNTSSSSEPVNDDSSEPGTPRVSSARLSDGESSTTASANAVSFPPQLTTSASSSLGSLITMPGRHAYRQAIQSRLLPALRAFNPDLILMSTGFDAVQGDVGNARHEKDKERMGLDILPEDYAWTTRQILHIADICCQGRVVSILEGGYGRTPPTMGEVGAATQGGTAATTLDRSIFGDCAIRHLHAMVDPYDAEQRFG